MRKRALITLGLLGTVALLGVALLLWLTPRPRIDPDSFEQLQIGMSEHDVERVMGAPAGDYSRSGRRIFYGLVDIIEGPRRRWPEFRAKEWRGDEFGVIVAFDEDGRVADKAMGTAVGGVTLSSPTSLDRLRRWFRR
jgi:hypothetical protein